MQILFRFIIVPIIVLSMLRSFYLNQTLDNYYCNHNDQYRRCIATISTLTGTGVVSNLLYIQFWFIFWILIWLSYAFLLNCFEDMIVFLCFIGREKERLVGASAMVSLLVGFVGGSWKLTRRQILLSWISTHESQNKWIGKL